MITGPETFNRGITEKADGTLAKDEQTAGHGLNGEWGASMARGCVEPKRG